MVVLVGALARLPVIEPKALLRRDVCQPPAILAIGAAVHMPLPDVAGAIAGTAEGFAQGRPLRLQFHIVDEDAMSERILAGDQAGAIGTADGASGNGRLEVGALPRRSDPARASRRSGRRYTRWPARAIHRPARTARSAGVGAAPESIVHPPAPHPRPEETPAARDSSVLLYITARVNLPRWARPPHNLPRRKPGCAASGSV